MITFCATRHAMTEKDGNMKTNKRTLQLERKLRKLQKRLAYKNSNAREKFQLLSNLWATHDEMERYIIAEERYFSDREVDYMTEPGRTWKEMVEKFPSLKAEA